MPNYTIEELQQMLNKKIDEEIASSSIETSEQIIEREINDSDDSVRYILRDSNKFDKLIYSYIQSSTIGKRMTTWCKYKPVVENGIIITYRRTNISQSISADLTETFSQTELIIEE